MKYNIICLDKKNISTYLARINVYLKTVGNKFCLFHFFFNLPVVTNIFEEPKIKVHTIIKLAMPIPNIELAGQPLLQIPIFQDRVF